MRRLKIFAKGNVDVFDSLMVCRIGGEVAWNGVNQALRERGLDAVARVRHETSTGARTLVHPPAVDGPLAADPEGLKPFPLAMQTSAEVFATDAEAIVLSVLADVQMQHYRNSRTGDYLFVPHLEHLDQASAERLLQTHVLVDLASPEEVFADLVRIVTRIRSGSQAPILIYNMSPLAPGPVPHCYLGLKDSLVTRIRRFNLMLVELSEQTGVSIVDVESIVAKAGADRIKLDLNHMTGEGARLVAHEVVHVLQDSGLFD